MQISNKLIKISSQNMSKRKNMLNDGQERTVVLAASAQKSQTNSDFAKKETNSTHFCYI